jgi:hypothetical protein
MWSSAEQLGEAALDETEWSPAKLIVNHRPTEVMIRTLFSTTTAYSLDSGFAAAWRGDIEINHLHPMGNDSYAANPTASHSLNERHIIRPDYAE